jgi:hypothetical protein
LAQGQHRLTTMPLRGCMGPLPGSRSRVVGKADETNQTRFGEILAEALAALAKTFAARLQFAADQTHEYCRRSKVSQLTEFAGRIRRCYLLILACLCVHLVTKI